MKIKPIFTAAGETVNQVSASPKYINLMLNHLKANTAPADIASSVKSPKELEECYVAAKAIGYIFLCKAFIQRSLTLNNVSNLLAYDKIQIVPVPKAKQLVDRRITINKIFYYTPELIQKYFNLTDYMFEEVYVGNPLTTKGEDMLKSVDAAYTVGFTIKITNIKSKKSTELTYDIVINESTENEIYGIIIDDTTQIDSTEFQNWLDNKIKTI